GAALHGSLNRLLDRSPECDAPLELVGDGASHQVGVQFGRPDLLDVDADAPAREALQVVAQLLDFAAATADDDAGLRRVDRHGYEVGVPVDLHAADAGIREFLEDVAAQV